MDLSQSDQRRGKCQGATQISSTNRSSCNWTYARAKKLCTVLPTASDTGGLLPSIRLRGFLRTHSSKIGSGSGILSSDLNYFGQAWFREELEMMAFQAERGMKALEPLLSNTSGMPGEGLRLSNLDWQQRRLGRGKCGAGARLEGLTRVPSTASTCRIYLKRAKHCCANVMGK